MKIFLIPLLAALALPTAVNAYEEVCKNKLRFLGYEDYKRTYRLESLEIAYSSSKKISDDQYKKCDSAELGPGPWMGYQYTCNGVLIYDFQKVGMADAIYSVFDKYGNSWKGRELSSWKKTEHSPTCTQISKNQFFRESRTYERIYLPKAKIFFFLKDHRTHYYTQDPTKINFESPNFN